MEVSITTTDETPKRLSAQLKAIKALQLRVLGRTWDDIGKELGYASGSGAYNAVSRLMAEQPKPSAEEWRALSLERLEAGIKQVMEQLETGYNRADVYLLATLVQAEAKLLGIDDVPKQPVEPVAKVYIGLDIDRM